NIIISAQRFEQFERDLDRLEGEVESYDLKGKSGLDEEFVKLEHETEIEKELALLKEKAGTRTVT
ncbi:MAG: hypothetical protein HQM16_19075, partial [Deltaproteobacteria bacterium]|nr:hypothetical protein [Deltaproteobacteria bacterium]